MGVLQIVVPQRTIVRYCTFTPRSNVQFIMSFEVTKWSFGFTTIDPHFLARRLARHFVLIFYQRGPLGGCAAQNLLVSILHPKKYISHSISSNCGFPAGYLYSKYIYIYMYWIWKVILMWKIIFQDSNSCLAPLIGWGSWYQNSQGRSTSMDLNIL